MTMAVRALSRTGLGRGRRISQVSKTRFDARTLFVAGAPGLAYDFNDFFALFQDSAGTTPVTAAGQLVGLVLDKSKGLVLGANISQANYVTASSYTNTTTVVSDTELSMGAGAGAGRSVSNLSPYVSSFVWYEISCRVVSISAGTVTISLRDSADGTGTVLAASAPGTTAGSILKCYAMTTRNIASLLFVTSVASNVSIADISVKKIEGNHAFQATTASRPILRQSPILGPELVSNGTFDTGTEGWVGDVNTTLSVESGRLRATRTGAGNPRASVAITNLVIGNVYLITIDLIRGPVMGGNIFLRASLTNNLSETTYLNKAHVNSTSQATAQFTAVATTMYIGAVAETSSTDQYFEIDNASICEITSYYADRNYLEFDGVDDFLATGNIDLSSTDKVSVFAGISVVDTNALMLIAEISASSSSNNGAFGLFSSGNTESVLFRSKGTADAQTTVSKSHPYTSVISTKGWIASDINEIRIDGVLSGSISSDQGSGNFGNYPIYIGRRGGSSLPFKGNLYSLVIVGKLASDSEITNTERYIAKHTGVTLP